MNVPLYAQVSEDISYLGIGSQVGWVVGNIIKEVGLSSE